MKFTSTCKIRRKNNGLVAFLINRLRPGFGLTAAQGILIQDGRHHNPTVRTKIVSGTIGNMVDGGGTIGIAIRETNLSAANPCAQVLKMFDQRNQKIQIMLLGSITGAVDRLTVHQAVTLAGRKRTTVATSGAQRGFHGELLRWSAGTWELILPPLRPKKTMTFYICM